MRFKRLRSSVHIDDPKYLKVTAAGNIVKVVSMRDAPGLSPIRRVDGDMYLNIVTGQYGEYHHSETKADLVHGVRVSLDRLRMIINANCVDSRHLLWLTLTYAENMQDVKRLYFDFNRFIVRLRRYLKRLGFPSVEYIVVAEPQARGAWHLHCILIFPCLSPFIPNADIESMWEQGFTKTKAVHGVDNLGAYFSAYLADLPLSEAQDANVVFDARSVIEKCVVDDDESASKKKFVKGARLKLYPAGMKFYRCSRGITRPLSAVFRDGVGHNSIDEWTSLKEKVGLAEPTFSKSLVVLDDAPGSCQEVNSLTVQYYNMLQSDCQVKRNDALDLEVVLL